MNIEVQHERQWGKDHYYPLNDTGNHLLEFLNLSGIARKGFNADQLKALQKAGCGIKIHTTKRVIEIAGTTYESQ